jgi:hypothetical protein
MWWLTCWAGTPQRRCEMGAAPVTRQQRPLLAVVAAAAIVALAASGVLLGPGSLTRAGADPPSSCSTTTGVMIVVDFSSPALDDPGGAVNRQCDPDTSTDALTAMNAEGFTTAGDSHDGGAFVCRINGLPTPAQDPCVNTPPASAYWAFWIANPGQTSWSVSPLGAMSLYPKPGSTELWSYGSGATPSFPPSAVAATDPVTPTTVPSPVTTAPAPPGGTGSGSGTTGSNGTGTKGTGANGTGAGAVGKAGATPHTTAPLKSTGTTGTPAAAGGTPSQGTRPAATRTPTSRLHIVDAAPASSKTHPTSGSPAALIVGSLAVLALAACALIVVRRRRLE